MKHLKPKTLVAALAVCFTPFYAYADNAGTAAAGTAAEQEVKLKTIQVRGQKRVHRKSQDVTGLGKVIKTAERLEKEQVQGVRDMVRYDPGISVVEQGRGGSSGFSIRGVDKNRVLVSVDGIPQLQSYADTTSNSGGSGSMNEVEFENVSAVEISKGGNGSESGSGALGGSVNYHTKNVDDLLSDGRNWGLRSNTAYSSKDKRFAQSVGGAFRMENGLEGLLQYTGRKGNETGIHSDAADGSQSFYKLDAYEHKYDLRYEPDRLADNLFRFENCTDDACVKNGSSLTRADLWQPNSRTQPYTAAEEQQRSQAMRHRLETVSAKQYTGNNRIQPNPMEYQSGSWLARLGYRFSPEHYAGWLFENTTQQYDSRDMRHTAYYGTEADLHTFGKPPVYIGDTRTELAKANNSNGIWQNDPREGYANLLWTRARFLEEKHNKQRNGLNYRYTPSENRWADQIDLSLDRQNIKTDTATQYAACSPYGDNSTTLNCAPSTDKPGSYLNREQIKYKENHLLFNAKWQKNFDFEHGRHKVQASAGIDRFDSSFDKYLENTAAYKRQERIGSETRTVNGQTRNVAIWRDLGGVLATERPCTDWEIDTCTRLPIKGKGYHIALRDNMALGKYVDLSLGLRLDRHSFQSDDSSIRSKRYLNKSWNAGIVLKPNSNWALSYRASNGFRVPSFQELYGYNVPGIPRGGKYQYIADLSPEKSFNQEIGVALKGGLGNIELSAFDSRYRDLIAYAVTAPDKDGIQKLGNFNLQNADLQGINLRSNVDLNAVWEKIPEGLSLNLAYNRIKAKRLFNNTQEKWAYVSDYPLETIQPSRYVVGLNYDAPSEKWGIAANWTHSRGKNPDELISKVDHGNGKTYQKASTQAATKPWTTVDFIGYWKPWKHATLRAGVYNAFNYRYLMWENVRQSSRNSLAQQQPAGASYSRFAAPGRNFTLGFEMKF
ncbi:MAG: lactoferrin/transferrin family TonB-dependent receptor [Neisseria sp.]|nr:lactoferrin/transferrin family TonB-dependent receptor [Neisseria sp.]